MFKYFKKFGHYYIAKAQIIKKSSTFIVFKKNNFEVKYSEVYKFIIRNMSFTSWFFNIPLDYF